MVAAVGGTQLLFLLCSQLGTCIYIVKSFYLRIIALKYKLFAQRQFSFDDRDYTFSKSNFYIPGVSTLVIDLKHFNSSKSNLCGFRFSLSLRTFHVSIMHQKRPNGTRYETQIPHSARASRLLRLDLLNEIALVKQLVADSPPLLSFAHFNSRWGYRGGIENSQHRQEFNIKYIRRIPITRFYLGSPNKTVICIRRSSSLSDKDPFNLHAPKQNLLRIFISDQPRPP